MYRAMGGKDAITIALTQVGTPPAAFSVNVFAASARDMIW
jgi:hypothetical protein